MPTLSQKDSQALDVLDRWRETVIDESDEMSSWIRTPIAKRYLNGWPEEPKSFYSDTSYVIHWIATHHPSVPTEPLLELYGLITAWHKDLDDKSAPSEGTLEAAVGKARVVLSVAECAILKNVHPMNDAPPPSLTTNAAAVYEMLCALPPHRAMLGREIVDALNAEHGTLIDESTLTRRIIPALKPYGIENKRRVGYRITPGKRPPPGPAPENN